MNELEESFEGDLSLLEEINETKVQGGWAITNTLISWKMGEEGRFTSNCTYTSECSSCK